MITTAKFEKTSATVKKIVDWAISSPAARKLAEGSTTSIGTYRVVPKFTMPRMRGCLTLYGADTIMSVEGKMPRRIVPQVTKEMVEEAYKNGGSLAGAARILDVSKKCILNWMKKFDIPRNLINPIDIEAICEMAKMMSASEIAKATGYTRCYITEIAKANGFKCANKFHKGFAVTYNGYKLVKRGGNRASGYILLHRAIMEDHIGRKLEADEVVHHINGNKMDNRIENLEIMSKSEHARLHYSETKPSPYKSKV